MEGSNLADLKDLGTPRITIDGVTIDIVPNWKNKNCSKFLGGSDNPVTLSAVYSIHWEFVANFFDESIIMLELNHGSS